MNTTINANSKSKDRNIGVDVGKDTLDIFIYECNKHWQDANTLEGVKQLIKQLNRYQLTRVLVEATGGYERRLVEACAERLADHHCATDAGASVCKSPGSHCQDR